MPEPAVTVGDKVHIITRRLFDSDIRRNFVGEVTGASEGLHEVTGYAFVFQPGVNEYKKRPELRRRIFSLGDAALIVIKIPRDVAIESIAYRMIANRLVVTDGDRFTLDIDEFAHGR